MSMTSGKPLSVAIAALVHDGKILLIRRVRGDYVGKLALPGGKVELGEHLAQAAVREIKEESGIDSRFAGHLGVVSEHLVESGEVTAHFLLHVCRLEPLTTQVTVDSEGTLEWFPLDRLDDMADELIPSDHRMISAMVVGGKGGYHECLMERKGDELDMRFFR